ncbi:MAG: hypothetical protein B0W54_00750 [Cellvibrio sp. 79]|nr:MAG: hypothetical protein B0W54_00750 [Cellvibrio sp. 79]
MKIKKSYLEEIKSRLASASPGAWVSYVEGRDHTSGCNFIMTGVGGVRGQDIELSGATNSDQDFIAHARQDIEVLIKILEGNNLVDDD